MKGDRLDEREARQQIGARARDMQGHRAAERMSYKMRRFPCAAEQRAYKLRLVLQAKGAASGPMRSAAVAVKVGRDDAEAIAQPLHQRAPLRARARRAVQQHDRLAAPLLEILD